VLTGENRKEKAGREEAGSQDGSGLSQGIAGAATSHEAATAAADAERAPFGALQQHNADQSQCNHDVN
jgi:hypothetical protein